MDPFLIGGGIILIAVHGTLAFWSYNKQRNLIANLNRLLRIGYITALVFLVALITIVVVTSAWLGYAGKQREEPSSASWNIFGFTINLFHNQYTNQYQSAKWPWDLQSVIVAILAFTCVVTLAFGVMFTSVQFWQMRRPPQQAWWIQGLQLVGIHIHHENNQRNWCSIVISGLSLFVLIILASGLYYYHHYM